MYALSRAHDLVNKLFYSILFVTNTIRPQDRSNSKQEILRQYCTISIKLAVMAKDRRSGGHVRRNSPRTDEKYYCLCKVLCVMDFYYFWTLHFNTLSWNFARVTILFSLDLKHKNYFHNTWKKILQEEFIWDGDFTIKKFRPRNMDEKLKCRILCSYHYK